MTTPPINGNRLHKVSDATAQRILDELAKRVQAQREAEARRAAGESHEPVTPP